MKFRADLGLVKNRAQRVFYEFRLAFLDHQQRVLAFAELQELVFHDGVGDVQDVKRNFGLAVYVGQPQPLQGADDAIIHTAL